MKLLVVGAVGGVGRALVEQAVERGHAVTAFVRDASNSGNVANFFYRWIFAPTFLHGAVKDKTTS